jgi:hypothetical protein
VGSGSVEIVDLDVQVHHHLLVTPAGRPDRRDVGRLLLKRQADVAVWRPYPLG